MNKKVQTTQTTGRNPKASCVMSVHDHGSITDRGRIETLKSQNKTGRRGGRRSAITTFSRKSAARLRMLLAQITGPKGWPCFGMTLTVPGPNIPPEELRRLWRAYYHRLLRMETVALVWRIEMQKRGQPHFHCICWSKNGPDEIRMAWFETLGLLGPYEGPAVTAGGHDKLTGQEPGEATQEIIRVSHRGLWPGAALHAVRIDEIGNEGNIGWWRYLAAHASKSKQSQLGWQGRQWGRVNKHLLELTTPKLIELTHGAEVKVMRYLKRLIRCRFASPHGKQTWFISPSTSIRLCEWAIQASGL